MYIINPDPYSLPCYRIGPFKTRDIELNFRLPKSDAIDQYFSNRFDGKEYIYTENGRKAINLALSHYKLTKNDIVTILTTTDNFYISGCVTKEIEKFCLWSRKIEKKTKVIFINHEFGYPFPDLSLVKNFNIPIIEDCANSFFSTNSNNTIGNIGDFVIYSFPKMFPIQIGGLLKININNFNHRSYKVHPELEQYIKNVLSQYIKFESKIKLKRLKNYMYLERKFKSLYLQPRFQISDNIIPGVFMFCVNNDSIDLQQLKTHFYSHGIQCSVFYGERAFFIPCHQALNKYDLNYFVEVIKSFLDNVNNKLSYEYPNRVK